MLKKESSKSSKEDITKSQTYQQFMKNMEHELRRLEETEQPSNNGKWSINHRKGLPFCFDSFF